MELTPPIPFLRRISLFKHLLEEIRDFGGSSSSASLWSADPAVARQADKRLVSVTSACNIDNSSSSCCWNYIVDGGAKILSPIPMRYMEAGESFRELPYHRYQISEEVQEQVSLVKAQLRRAIERYGSFNSRKVSNVLSQPLGSTNGKISAKLDIVPENCDRTSTRHGAHQTTKILERGSDDCVYGAGRVCHPTVFLSSCLLILHMYERSYIQRWIDCGNIEQPSRLTNGRLKTSNGSFDNVSDDIAAIQALVCKLSSWCLEEHRVVVAEIRSLSERSTDNRILTADAGAIPVLVNLLTTDDVSLQEHAVTSILNLSIFENKSLMMLAAGSMEARENAAATLFRLSLADVNKIIIGASGAIPALVDLLQNGSTKGKKDAATSLFNLCIYQGNKGRAVRAGTITALLKMLTDSTNSMIDEALAILSVLASSHYAKVAIVKASIILLLIDLIRTVSQHKKKKATAILLCLCKRDTENLSCISSHHAYGFMLIGEHSIKSSEKF
ncbi:hypothetical protein CXB51_005066 [Gossypium anomalum]|uniref:Uncharacterized protein n=1 Tax=Gossypium anomalum TaxID=47600 RepID=A0A8J5ZD86_9ROSI|nr:hypothetical protein CXB51_005066 [Gossypium anomalum]